MENPWLENMKRKHEATTEFRVPLSSEALKILTQARLLSRHDFLATCHGPLSSKIAPYSRIFCHNIGNKQNLSITTWVWLQFR
ncbi:MULTISPECIES: hypothetical protein [unclassified Bartonella]|uniref:hypothetical protein n=1 Tax=unclassified Bartonella TaxID=2645622 RepID=UPI0035D0E127